MLYCCNSDSKLHNLELIHVYPKELEDPIARHTYARRILMTIVEDDNGEIR